jgi:hypothetical protein
VSSLIFSQSNYPLQTVIKGDSVVILTKKQAQDINNIFESQKNKIASLNVENLKKDSLLLVKEYIILLQDSLINNFSYNEELARRLDLLEHWLDDMAKRTAWIYYSWKDTSIYAVDLSYYYVRKDNITGDISFYRHDEPFDTDNNQEEPPRNWYNDIIKPKRPVVIKAPK